MEGVHAGDRDPPGRRHRARRGPHGGSVRLRAGGLRGGRARRSRRRATGRRTRSARRGRSRRCTRRRTRARTSRRALRRPRRREAELHARRSRTRRARPAPAAPLPRLRLGLETPRRPAANDARSAAERDAVIVGIEVAVAKRVRPHLHALETRGAQPRGERARQGGWVRCSSQAASTRSMRAGSSEWTDTVAQSTSQTRAPARRGAARGAARRARVTARRRTRAPGRRGRRRPASVGRAVPPRPRAERDACPPVAAPRGEPQHRGLPSMPDTAPSAPTSRPARRSRSRARSPTSRMRSPGAGASAARTIRRRRTASPSGTAPRSSSRCPRRTPAGPSLLPSSPLVRTPSRIGRPCGRGIYCRWGDSSAPRIPTAPAASCCSRTASRWRSCGGRTTTATARRRAGSCSGSTPTASPTTAARRACPRRPRCAR